MIEQNNNSNIDILNVSRINHIEYNIKNNLIKNNCKEEYNLKNKFNLKEENPKIVLNKTNLYSSSKKSNAFLPFYENFKSDKSQNKCIKNRMKYLFPYYYFLMDCIFDRLHPEKFFCVPKAYLVVYNYMCQIYDISSHIILFKQVDILKKIFEGQKYENQDEINSLRKFQKINIKHSKTIDQIDKDLKQRKAIIFSEYI